MSGPVDTADAPSASTADIADAGPVLERLPSRAVDLAGMPVRRALPKRQRRTIGAWCFVDHFGPASPPDVEPMMLGPHPHIGLHTVTWLLAGEVVHRDSLGSEQPIRPGQLNLMTAGRGIVHAEETPPGNRETQHGAQLWIAMPEATRGGDPAFEHHAELPQDEYGGLVATTLIGGGSTARADTPIVGIALHGDGGGTLPLDPGHEHGIVVLEGAVEVAGERVEPGELAYLGLGRDELDVVLQPATHALLLGGEPFDEDILMWWNYVVELRGPQSRRGRRGPPRLAGRRRALRTRGVGPRPHPRASDHVGPPLASGTMSAPREVEKMYSTAEVVAKLRRLADALETGKPFRIQVAGERIHVPVRAEFSVAHERGDDDEEIEFQFTWSLEDSDSEEDDETVV